MLGYFDLSERVALVTGASRGLGLAMAEALADAGATVVLNGRDANTLKAAADVIEWRAYLLRCVMSAIGTKLNCGDVPLKSAFGV